MLAEDTTHEVVIFFFGPDSMGRYGMIGGNSKPDDAKRMPRQRRAWHALGEVSAFLGAKGESSAKKVD